MFSYNPLKTMYVTSGFGYRTDPFTKEKTYHNGIDLRGAEGTSVYAVENGTVVARGNYNDGYGNKIIIEHPNGYRSHYAHLSYIAVQSGQQVVGGEVIGGVGNTGRSTAPHLHFGVDKTNRKGVYHDPTPLLPSSNKDFKKLYEEAYAKLTKIKNILGD